MRANINGAELLIDTFGDPADPAVLLIMGGGRLHGPLGARLLRAARRRRPVRDPLRPPRHGRLDALAARRAGLHRATTSLADALGVLDHLGVERAHLVGLSMGGALAQHLAVEHPERVASLALLSTSPAGTGGPELPPMSDELRAVFSGEGEPEPDWSDREAAIAYLLEAERPYAGARGLDEEATREVIGRAYDRSPSPASANNHFMVDGRPFRPRRLGEIAVPVLVVHGSDDPLFPPAHGEALAAAIPGAAAARPRRRRARAARARRGTRSCRR